MTTGIVRVVTPWAPGVAEHGPSQVAVSRTEGELRCHDCQRLHSYNVGREVPNQPGESVSRLLDDWEAAYSLALAWLPEAAEYYGRRLADDEDERNEARRFDNRHEAVDWLLQST